jgi:hypothetical protein
VNLEAAKAMDVRVVEVSVLVTAVAGGLVDLL